MSAEDKRHIDGQPDLAPPSRAEHFDALYVGAPPWVIGRPQPAFLRLAEAGAVRGRVLDVGCGTGEHALMAAALGLAATGIDTSPTAISLAERKAQARNLRARFLVWDALDLPALGEQFDTVLDSGLFHVFDDEDRSRYVESLRAVVAPGGRYYLLCFGDRQPGVAGPRRVSQDEIRASFAGGWRVESIEEATMDLAIAPTGVAIAPAGGRPPQALAWLATITPP